jgi:CHASE2 domain-containing sensor protein
MPVLIEDYDSISQGGNQTLEIMSLPKFQCNATLGFVNAILENDGFDTQRYFMHSKTLGDSVIYHFAICAAMKYDSIRTFNFLNRSKMISEINYFGNDKAFKTFSDFDVFDGKLNREDIEGKIVLIGYMGPYPGFRHNNDDDKYFTPLNAKVPPYSPDMYGVIIHANIIAQALNR